MKHVNAITVNGETDRPLTRGRGLKHDLARSEASCTIATHMAVPLETVTSGHVPDEKAVFHDGRLANC